LEHHVSINFSVAACDDFSWAQNHCDGIATIFGLVGVRR
jgi:hypothetical protein